MAQVSDITLQVAALEQQGQPLESIAMQNTLSNHYPFQDATLVKNQLQLNSYNLLGVGSVLPDHYSASIREQLIDRDANLLEFIDMLNAHVARLLVKTERRNQVHQHQSLGKAVASSIGELDFNTASASDYFFAGFNAHNASTPNAIENMVSHYFAVNCSLESLSGRMTALPLTSCSKLGMTGQHNRLGQTCSLGTRLFNPQGEATVVIQHKNLTSYRTFLPITNKAESLKSFLKQHASSDLSFHLTHQLPTRSIGPAKLGEAKTAHLGWNTWLGASNHKHYQSRISLGDINHG